MVSVDKAKCIGCGLCISICSAVFDMGDDGKAFVKDDNAAKKESCVAEAIKNCPVQAILATGAKPQAKKK